MRPLLLVLLAATACSQTVTETPDVYAFDGRDGATSVSYSGQVFRHLLISDLSSHLDGVTARIDGGWVPAQGDLSAEVEFFLAFDGDTAGELPFLLSTDPAPKQSNYGDVASGKDLLGKLAGNDEVGQHKDWSSELVGWSDPKVDGPEALVRHWVAEIDAAAVQRGQGQIAKDPSGAPIPSVYVTEDGLDHRQLLDKFLRGGIAFSQGTDDYLDDDVEGKGLLADHTALEIDEPYTALEHAWDEGFGYFGAAQSYGTLTDDQIAEGPYDADGDGSIDLLSEINVGHSVNAAKRDRSSQAGEDFTEQAWINFATGRQLLADNDGALSDSDLDALRAYRDGAVSAWEKSISASVVHYINDVLQDMNGADSTDYSFADHAKHWSELKGFALALQFNPHSPLSDSDLASLHELIGERPVLSNASEDAQAEYAGKLRQARTLLGDAYGFDASDLGGDNGEDGW